MGGAKYFLLVGKVEFCGYALLIVVLIIKLFIG